MLVPQDHDGGSVTEQPLVDLVVLAEELGRVLYPGPFAPTNVVAGRAGTRSFLLAAAPADAVQRSVTPSARERPAASPGIELHTDR